MKMFRVVVNGSEYKVGIEELDEDTTSRPSQVTTPPPSTQNQPQAPPKAPVNAPAKPAAARPESTATGGTIVAPMPGTVLQVAVSVGDNVTKGQTLLILEAMKMENEIMAPSDGVVKELNITKGGSVNTGDILVILSA